MNNDEFYEYESRAYINPTLSSGEQEAFINSLRDVQNQNNAQIAEQTYNLGTAVPSNLGGLGGGEAYFTSRYQTPQVGEMVATLKAAVQAQELQDAMKNYQAQLKNRYSQANRAYNKRQRARAAAAALGGGNNGGNNGGNDGVVDVITGDTINNLEGLAFEKWKKDNNFDQFVQPQTIVNSGVPIATIIEAQNELQKKWNAQTIPKPQNSVLQNDFSVR